MSNDLLFYVIPREGKVPMERDEMRVERLQKDAAVRAVRDDEENLQSEDRQAREKQQKKKRQQAGTAALTPEKRDDELATSMTKKKLKDGLPHIDCYI